MPEYLPDTVAHPEPQPYVFIQPGRALNAPADTCPPIERFMIDGGTVEIRSSFFLPPELRSLVLGAAGYTNGETALKSKTTEDAVKHHWDRIFEETGCRRKTSVVSYCFADEDWVVTEPVSLAAYELTPRHVDILQLAAGGLSHAQIGSKLGIRENTVKAHNETMYRQMKAPNMVGAVLRGYMSGLIIPECFTDISEE